MSASQYILVSNPIIMPDENSWRDSSQKNIAKVPLRTLSGNIQKFVDDISKTLDEIDANISKFEMKQIEVYAAITATGELSLLGVGGGGLGVEGGIKFVFIKKENKEIPLKKKTSRSKPK